MNKIIKIHLFLCLAFLTSCDWFSSNKSSDTSVPDSYSAEFELTEAVPALTACQGTRTIDYRVKTCFKNGRQTELSNCANLTKSPLEVESPEGTRTFAIEGEESNFIGDKTYSCDEGESMSEEKVDVSCSDSRYIKYSLNDNGIMDSCKPYPVDIENNIVTDSIGDIYELIINYENYNLDSVRKINFPKVKKAYMGNGGVCGHNLNTVFCQKLDVFGTTSLGNVEIVELSRNVNIQKMVHSGNLICVLYEDKEVGCSQSLRFFASPGNKGTEGSAGRGQETNSSTYGQVSFERTSPLIPEYFGAVDIIAGGVNNTTSCALFSNESVKCSGFLGELNPNEENEYVNMPINVSNSIIKLRSIGEHSYNVAALKFSFCPFPEYSEADCFFVTRQINEDEYVSKRIYSLYDNTGQTFYRKELYVSNLGKMYLYNTDGFHQYNNLQVDSISINGFFVIKNKNIYLNQELPILIRLN